MSEDITQDLLEQRILGGLKAMELLIERFKQEDDGNPFPDYKNTIKIITEEFDELFKEYVSTPTL